VAQPWHRPPNGARKRKNDLLPEDIVNNSAATKLPCSLFALALSRRYRQLTCVVIATLLLLLRIPVALANINFAAPTSYPVGTSPAAIAVGDFNGDGKMDIAVANNGSGDVSILLGNGDATFQAATNFSAGSSPNSIAVGDFNGDGKLDLAVFQTGAGGSISILLGNGDGTFQSPKTLTASVGYLAVADFDGDKKSDLAVCDSTNLNIFISNGDGTFQAPKATALSSGCKGLFTADFNGDSKPDLGLVISDGLTTGGIQILLGKGDGTFSTGALISDTGVHTPVATDLNHDGKVDLVASKSQVSCQSGPPTVCQATVAIVVFLGNGDGTFQKEQTITGVTFGVPSGRNPSAEFVVGDFNGDGKPDLAYQLPADPTPISGILLGRGDGSFSSSVADVPLPGNAQQMMAADLNSDKLADVIAIGVGTNANNIEVWLNTSPTSGADLAVLSPAASAGPYVVGANVTFTANVVNQGPTDATGVTFTDTLGSGLTFVSATATPGSCVQTNGGVSCTIGALASAFESSINIVSTPTVLGTISNTMSVAGNEPDPVSANNSATQTVDVVPVFVLTVTDAGKGSGTVTAGAGAINCGTTCTGTYPQGTSVSLTATPSTGAIFSSWSGACTGTDPNTCTVVMNSAQSVTATFGLPPDFSLAVASPSLTLQTEAQGTDALTLTGENGFSGQVNLTCMVNGTAPLATCGVSPSSVTVGSSPGTSTLTITAPSSLVAYAVPVSRGISGAILAVVLPLPGVLLAGAGLAGRRVRMRRIRLWFLGSGLIALLAVMAGCGSGSPPPPKNYTVTITATPVAGSVQHTATVSLTVN
jgi:uncharacterized repeat protein (TIGR01451 family)